MSKATGFGIGVSLCLGIRASGEGRAEDSGPRSVTHLGKKAQKPHYVNCTHAINSNYIQCYIYITTFLTRYFGCSPNKWFKYTIISEIFQETVQLSGKTLGCYARGPRFNFRVGNTVRAQILVALEFQPLPNLSRTSEA